MIGKTYDWENEKTNHCYRKYSSRKNSISSVVIVVFHFRRKPIWADGPRLTQIYYSPQIRLTKECRWKLPLIPNTWTYDLFGKTTRKLRRRPTRSEQRRRRRWVFTKISKLVSRCSYAFKWLAIKPTKQWI